MGKNLVVFFSATGATKRLAQKIANALEADIFEIEPAVGYTDDDIKWPSRDNRSCIEMKNKSFRPLVLNKIEGIEKYDNIFLGFPIWYYTAPTIVNTFIEENHLEGKNTYVFVTSGVNSVDKSFKDLKKMYPDINFISGRRFSGAFYEKELYNWLEDCAS
ncbi:MAG: NAD(P)H-dependent oxidoreductase [Clostridia bacterium]|nr:NAD(P)H-dependent oxidoreductase [Clostridia bacterium]